MKISHILVASDLSREAMSCIPSVADLARSTQARVTLLHVVDSFVAIPQGTRMSPLLEAPEALEGMKARARTELEERRTLYGSGIDIKVDVVTGEDAAKEITAYAAANGVDLIAMTTHGRTGFRRMMLGSVAELVIRQATVPVLVLPLAKE